MDVGVNASVAIVGAGPYSLATGAFLRSAGVEARLYGDVMGFWEAMPEGMFLRSHYRASNIADPKDALTLPRYEAAVGQALARPIPLRDFVDYGRWFRDQAELEVDSRWVTSVARDGRGFRIVLQDGEEAVARRVIVAAGIGPFAWRPPEFEDFDRALVSHTSEHRVFDAFKGRSVVVVGGGQSALESAALLHEAGADVELVVRRASLRFLRGERLYDSVGTLSRIMYPAWGVGPPGLNWVMGRPSWFALLPPTIAGPLARRSIRPAGGAWLRPRLESVRLSLGRVVGAVSEGGGALELTLDDGSRRTADHLMLGTGYRVDVRRYSFLDAKLLDEIRTNGGFPRLSTAFESSAPGLYFVGAPAAASAGPGMRFVSHTGFVASAITRHTLSHP
jgi:hypothetical protein